jgi:hypothetical protein
MGGHLRLQVVVQAREQARTARAARGADIAATILNDHSRRAAGRLAAATSIVTKQTGLSTATSKRQNGGEQSRRDKTQFHGRAPSVFFP